METLKLRPYQSECVAAVEEYWQKNPLRNAAVSLPTGSGKTVIFSEIARRAVERGERVAIIVDRDELVQQTVDKLRRADPMMFVGVVKAAKNEVAAEVAVCSIQTLRRPGRAEAILPRDVVIYDEAHGSAADSSVDVMKRLETIGGPTRAVGFSATFYRADRKPLDVIWDDVVFERSILWAVTEGYLSDARGVTIPIQGLDLGEVKVVGGDYQDRDLSAKMLEAHAAEQIAKAYVEHARGRVTICFAPTIAAAEEIADELVGLGVTADVVTGKTGAAARKELYDRLESGDLEVLCSVAVLTTGFDSPRVDCVLMARPTQSQGLFVQCVGRGLRLHPEKSECLILDVSGSAEDHSLIALPHLAGKEEKDTGESLKELADGIPPERMPRGLRANLRQYSEFDPFSRKRLPWFKTRKGVDFIAVEKGAYIFLMPHGDSFRVGRVSDRLVNGGRAGKWLQATPIPREFAFSLAEAYAIEEGVRYTASTMRRLNNPPTVAQVGYATTLGIEVSPDWVQKDVSQAIDVAKASAVID